ncbi:MAG: PAS domain S-box protein, partial [Methyloprofundus sp.]|nr:PAS domain S-box protein [Methyloprofundus sp.]
MPINDSLNTPPCSVDMQFLILASGEQVLHVNSAIHTLLGYATKDFFETDLRFAKLIHTADQNITEELFSLVAQETPKNINFRCRQQNGKIICLQGRYHKQYDQNAALILHLQLTDAKLLKQNLNDSIFLSNFTAMMENSEDYIFFKDRNHVFTAASQTLISITDPSEHWTDLIGKTDYDVFPEEYADNYYYLEKQLFSGAPAVQEIQKILDNQGNIGWVDNRKYPIVNKQGEIIGLFGIARDITENILNQQKVQKLLSEQKSILENNLIGIATVKN